MKAVPTRLGHVPPRGVLRSCVLRSFEGMKAVCLCIAACAAACSMAAAKQKTPGQRFVGSKSCRGCHLTEFNGWTHNIPCSVRRVLIRDNMTSLPDGPRHQPRPVEASFEFVEGSSEAESLRFSDCSRQASEKSEHQLLKSYPSDTTGILRLP